MADAITTVSDFKIHEPFVHTGVAEVDRQNIGAFNGGSNGAIQLRSRSIIGHYDYETFYRNNLSVRRRDITSTAAVDSVKILDDEFISVKINRGTDPVQMTRDAFRKKGQTAEIASLVIGRQLGVLRQKDMLNTALAATVGALTAADSGSLVADAEDGTLALSDIVAGMRLRGDSFTDLVCAVMHSQKFFDLVGDGISNYKIDTVAGMTLVSGPMTQTLGLSLVVTDSPDLIETDGVSSGVDAYKTLLLPAGAITVEESEAIEQAQNVVTGAENIMLEWQAEWAYNLGIMGFKWDTANGGINPTDAALATGTNWDAAVSDTKDLAGVVISSR